MKRRMNLVPHVRVAESAVMLVLAVFLLSMAAYATHVSRAVSSIYDQANAGADSVSVAQTFRGRCVLADNKTVGRVLADPDNRSSLCIPDGWQLYMDYETDVIIGSARESDGLLYRPGTVPTLLQNAGKQGPFSFQLYDYRTDAGAPAGFVKVGSFQAANATGVEYSFMQKADPVGGYIGNVPKGTKSTEYYFEKQGHAVVIDYWLFPGDPNHAAQVRQVAQSLTLF